jgi:hypothetical protein
MMTDNEPNEFMFTYNLYEFHLRREQALGFSQPSDFLHSLASALLFEASTRYAKAAVRLTEAEELYQTITKNKRKVDRLAKRIEKSNSKARINTWYSIALRLREETLEASRRLEVLDRG